MNSQSNSPPTLIPGTFVARYRIESLLGRGGMGDVYLATDTKLDRKVALKTLPAEVAADQERMRRFIQEAKAPAVLNHPNIAHIYEIGEAPIGEGSDRVVHFIAMEFIDGETLRHHMDRAQMDVRDVLQVAIQIADALAAAHAAGIVHRDVKPDNAMRREDGIVKVLDFGLAKLTEPKKPISEPEAQTTPLMLTEPGRVLGTITYMSPEQARGKEVDARTDIFSLGVVIYEMLTGVPPFSGETKADQLAAVLNQEPRPLSDFARGIPTELHYFVGKALRKDRDQRYESARDLLNDLKALKEKLDFDLKLKARTQPNKDYEAPPNLRLWNVLVETMKAAMADMGAASSTFYVRDPFWPAELRLVAMPGVMIREPMFGFSFPPHSTRVVAEGDTEIFSADTRFKPELREDAGWSLDRIDSAQRMLFGDFVDREQVKSSARLTYRVDDRTEAVLFVNFSETTAFDEDLKQKLRHLLDQTVTNLERLRNEIRSLEMHDLIQTVRMFPPTHDSGNEWDKPLKEYLESILRVTMEALGLEDTAFGTIHSYDHKTKTLTLQAGYPPASVLERAKSQSVETGEGIVSWVAIRRKALLITELSRSAFKKIHIPINADENNMTQSEVAIPIFAGEKLKGVLNLESSRPRAFRPTCVRSLWLAVNRAAVAHRMYDINERIRVLVKSFLELCREAVRQGKDGFSLRELADLATKELEAARCGIWHYDENLKEFELAALSPADDGHRPPRPGGLSRFILRLVRELGKSSAPDERVAWPIWVSRKDNDKSFEIQCWNGETWAQVPANITPPTQINPGVRPEVKALLGIPILGRRNCIGIAWLEYEEYRAKPLVSDIMKLATGFADFAGLVIEFSQIDLVDKEEAQRIGATLSELLLASGALDFTAFPRLEGYAISRPFPKSSIGGDFHAARVFDDRTAAVIVGDGQGHAVTGALNMLPILTTFEAFWKDSRSATYIMEKLTATSNKLGVKGTAIYCVFKAIGNELWMAVTSAGHPHLIIIWSHGGTDTYRHLAGNADVGMLGIPAVTDPTVEVSKRLSPGDVLIFYTDGLQLSDTEITQIGLAKKSENAQTIAQAVFDAALAGCKTLTDDATVLIVRVKTPESSGPRIRS